jgi:GT2 family glycosyltransferase
MKKDQPVSIVVLTHNNLAYTRACLERLAETTDNYEVVVVDNASSDETPTYLSSLESKEANVRVLLSDRNLGFAAGCNRGVAMARYGTICLLNNDIIPFDGWLDAMRSVFVKGVGAVGSKLVLPDYTLQHCGIAIEYREQPRPHYWPYHPFLGYPEELAEANEPREVAGVTAASLLTTKTIWDRVGGMDEGYRVANFEDVDFNLKLREAKLKVLYEPSSRLIHFWGKTVHSKSGQSDSPGRYFEQNFNRLMQKWFEKLQAGLVRL